MKFGEQGRETSVTFVVCEKNASQTGDNTFCFSTLPAIRVAISRYFRDGGRQNDCNLQLCLTNKYVSEIFGVRKWWHHDAEHSDKRVSAQNKSITVMWINWTSKCLIGFTITYGSLSKTERPWNVAGGPRGCYSVQVLARHFQNISANRRGRPSRDKSWCWGEQEMTAC